MRFKVWLQTYDQRTPLIGPKIPFVLNTLQILRVLRQSAQCPPPIPTLRQGAADYMGGAGVPSDHLLTGTSTVV
jgi:hypothetical protein